MKKKILIVLFSISITSYSQDVSLYKQFNGRYDFTMFGNTLNESENPNSCTILTTSSASLNLLPSQTLKAAYLYWAGSGTGDFDILLNGNAITAERTFSYMLSTASAGDQPFFAAFTEVTDLITSIGNDTYTVSELDMSDAILTNNYCANRTNFGGWGVLVIYQEDTLPLNQVSVFDGLQAVSRVQTELTLVLENLHVLDIDGAKIGFLTWEGDRNLAENETLRVNGNSIGNPPLNPITNAFNGTNSFTNSDTLYNMDLDYYDIENNIQIGDTEATIQLTSNADFVMVNTIITKFNSQLPDATIVLDTIQQFCNSRELLLDITIHNANSTDPLPANTSFEIYADGTFLFSSNTQNEIPISGQETQQVTVTIPASIPLDFTLELFVDNDQMVAETNENNNTFIAQIVLIESPENSIIENVTACNIGFEQGVFDIENVYQTITNSQPTSSITTFYPTLEDAYAETNEIIITSEYNNLSNPQIIYVKVINTVVNCFSINTFELHIENCPPTIPNVFTPNNDGVNDTFFITGLHDIFTEYNLEIYNRWGTKIYEENNVLEDWNGMYNNKKMPSSTYFYILNVKDTNYKPFIGWVYLLQ